MPPEVRSVWQLVRYLGDLLERDRRLQSVWIGGEVSNLTHARSGHIYFTLKDERAQIRCAFFRSQNIGQQQITAGDELAVHGSVGVYQQRGELQLIVDFVQPAGVGALQAEFERRRALYEAEGLFAPERKRPLPRFPERIAVVTSPDGAALHDVRSVLGRRWPLAQLVVAPALVQGEFAATSIAQAIRQATEESGERRPDVLIVTRGGGAAEDLWAFNDETVVRAIFGSPVPVISAIGHETDITLSDLVADVRAATPSAAAERAAPDRAEVQRQVSGLLVRGELELTGRLAAIRSRIGEQAARLGRSLPDLDARRRAVGDHADLMRRLLTRATVGAREQTIALSSRIDALSPLATLDRGYALVSRPGGIPVVRAVDLQTGDRVELRWRDGSRGARVESPR